MMYAMIIVIGAIALNILVGIIKAIVTNTFSISKLSNFLGGVLTHVVPLYALMYLDKFDPTGWVIPIMFYLGGISLLYKYLKDAFTKIM